MKLSVLIPTYNYTCYKLVQDLHEQLLHSGIEYEVIVMDDGSRDQVSIIANRKINELVGCQYIYNKDNVGRAAIRNRLADAATGEWLLFMDSDARVVRKDFIARYIAAIQDNTSVVCGGLVFPEICLDPARQLRWRYERNYTAEFGTISQNFRTSCFMIRKRVINKVCFDESYTGYGFEDMKFGMDLSSKGYQIYNIDNPIECGDIDTNEAYLKKTEESLKTLKLHNQELSDSRLLCFIEKHRILSYIIMLIYCMFRPMLKNNLLGPNPNMKYYAIYKLGYYMRLK